MAKAIFSNMGFVDGALITVVPEADVNLWCGPEANHIHYNITDVSESDYNALCTDYTKTWTVTADGNFSVVDNGWESYEQDKQAFCNQMNSYKYNLHHHLEDLNDSFTKKSQIQETITFIENIDIDALADTGHPDIREYLGSNNKYWNPACM